MSRPTCHDCGAHLAWWARLTQRTICPSPYACAQRQLARYGGDYIRRRDARR